jgi:hypothetical protein
MQFHYHNEAVIHAPLGAVFAFLDDPQHLTAHMDKAKGSWMMGGGGITATLDEGRGQRVGSHIKLNGRAFGLGVYLDEVIVQRDPPYFKRWQTVGDHRLLVIGDYVLGFELSSQGNGTRANIYIDYDYPKRNAWLGYLLGAFYARLCVDKMLNDTRQAFASPQKVLRSAPA